MTNKNWNESFYLFIEGSSILTCNIQMSFCNSALGFYDDQKYTPINI